MREFEGLSYREIGERLGMSRPSVESTLFRARRRLSEEYAELVSGERCRRIQAIIAEANGRLGVRNERKMARHVSYCQPCRRAAFAAGFDPATLQRKRTMREKIAALLPIPAFAKRWIAGGPADHSSLLSAAAQYGDAGGGAWVKVAAAIAAIVIAGVGADAVRPHGGQAAPAARPPAAVKAAPAAATTTPSARPSHATSSSGKGATVSHRAQRKRHGSSVPSSSGSGGSSSSSSSAPASGSGGGGSGASTQSSASTAAPSASSGAGDSPLKKVTKTVTDTLPTGTGSGASAPQVPTVQVPAPQVPNVQVPTVPGAPPAVNDTIGAVNDAAGQATGTVNDAASQATGAVNGTLSGATGAVNDTTTSAGDTVNKVTGGILGGG
jgi:hypothetical protein